MFLSHCFIWLAILKPLSQFSYPCGRRHVGAPTDLELRRSSNIRHSAWLISLTYNVDCCEFTLKSVRSRPRRSVCANTSSHRLRLIDGHELSQHFTRVSQLPAIRHRLSADRFPSVFTSQFICALNSYRKL